MLKDHNAKVMSPGSPCGGVDATVCAGCRGRIHDRFYLLAVDQQWHSSCLKCCECKLPLDAELTCFSRDGNIYCKDDYYRLFCVKRCNRCQLGITANELVMRVRDLVYHLHCFTCISCSVPLSKGDHFGIRDGLIYCRPHFELICNEDFCDQMEIGSMYRAGSPPPSMHYHLTLSSPTTVQKGRPRKRKIVVGPDSPGSDLNLSMRLTSNRLELLNSGDLSSSLESLSYDSSSVASPGSTQQSSQRTKRMRTSFKHHQLRTMKSYFAINQNPDAKDLKQLAQKTGLSKRVLQVWFQNARAKWRRNIMRQEGQQGAPSTNLNSLNSGASRTPPMITDSNSMSQQTMDDVHHMHGALTFSDLY